MSDPPILTGTSNLHPDDNVPPPDNPPDAAGTTPPAAVPTPPLSVEDLRLHEINQEKELLPLLDMKSYPELLKNKVSSDWSDFFNLHQCKPIRHDVLRRQPAP
jgi:hypothetical protein